MATLFTKIIDGEIPGAFVHQDDVCVAFLDVAPLTTGHVLVVPRAEVSEWTDLDDEVIAHLMRVARRIGRAQKEVFEAERIGVMIQGYEVPHVHIHVWPTTSTKDFDPANKGPMAEPEALAAAAETLRGALERSA